MYASVHLERKVKNEKPLNRAQRILRKNRKTFPKWYWRILQARSFETIEFSWFIPRAEVVINEDGLFSIAALSEGELRKENN